MALLSPPPIWYLTSRFQHLPTVKMYSADISDLTQGGTTFLAGRIYDDACDIGFGLVSAKTGKVAVFYEHTTSVNIDNDVEYWLFMPTTETLREFPQLRGYQVRVYND